MKYVGSRIGVLLSKYGLGCGWDDHAGPLIKDAAYYDTPSADSIGMNLVAYAIGYNRVGMEESKPELFAAVDEKTPTDEFVFAQIEHEGAFNVHPNSATALAVYFAAIETGLYVVPVNWHLAAAEVAYILGDSGARAFVAHERFAGVATEAADLAGIGPLSAGFQAARRARRRRFGGAPLSADAWRADALHLGDLRPAQRRAPPAHRHGPRRRGRDGALVLQPVRPGAVRRSRTPVLLAALPHRRAELLRDPTCSSRPGGYCDAAADLSRMGRSGVGSADHGLDLWLHQQPGAGRPARLLRHGTG